jgi:hypothetical protein
MMDAVHPSRLFGIKNFDHMWVVKCDEMHIGVVLLDSALMSLITSEILKSMRFESEA